MESIERKMDPTKLIASMDVPSISGLARICKAAGAAGSTVICSDKVVVFYKNPKTSGVQVADFVVALHMRHWKHARIFIAVFPVE